MSFRPLLYSAPNAARQHLFGKNFSFFSLTVNSMSISVNIAAAQWGPKRLPSNQTSSSQLAEETGIPFLYVSA
jgi:hypothetical protein